MIRWLFWQYRCYKYEGEVMGYKNSFWDWVKEFVFHGVRY